LKGQTKIDEKLLRLRKIANHLTIRNQIKKNFNSTENLELPRNYLVDNLDEVSNQNQNESLEHTEQMINKMRKNTKKLVI
jgi:hypothetical protein